MLKVSDDTQSEVVGSLLASAAPSFTGVEIQNLIKERFGVGGTAALLTSERDQNFHLVTGTDKDYVVKVTNAAEDPLVTDLQTQALLHIAGVDPVLPVPRILRTLDGKSETTALDSDGRPLIVRALSFLRGEPLHKVESSAAQLRNLGSCLGSLGLALRSFFHPAAGHELLWDIKNATRLWDMVGYIGDAQSRALVEHFLTRFERVVKPSLPRLRAQIVHNDFNPYNVMVSPQDHQQISGIFDFGDMVHTALVNDLAVCASYNVGLGEDALAGVVDIVSAYNRIVPLEPLEIELLLDLIATRLVTTVVITNWRADRYPQNRAYILRNAPGAWHGLERLSALDPAAVSNRLFNTCMGSSNDNG